MKHCSLTHQRYLTTIVGIIRFLLADTQMKLSIDDPLCSGVIHRAFTSLGACC
ncbi:MAG: hypothetical protein ACK50N_05790 [Flavobacteriales bacterium]